MKTVVPGSALLDLPRGSVVELISHAGVTYTPQVRDYDDGTWYAGPHAQLEHTDDFNYRILYCPPCVGAPVTMDQMNALPAGTVVQDCDDGYDDTTPGYPNVAIKATGHEWLVTGYGEPQTIEWFDYPVTILWLP